MDKIVDYFNDFFLGNPADKPTLQTSTITKKTVYKVPIPWDAYQCAVACKLVYDSPTSRPFITSNLIYNETLSNRKMAVFIDLTATPKAFIVFRGTQTDAIDFIDDLNIIAGGSFSLNLLLNTNRLNKMLNTLEEVGIKNIYFTGHSLGGFEAVYASNEYGIPAIVYNIGASPTQELSKSIREFKNKILGVRNSYKDIFDSNIIKSYIMEGDIIAETSKVLIPNTTVLKPKPKPKNLIEAHSIDFILKSITPTNSELFYGKPTISS